MNSVLQNGKRSIIYVKIIVFIINMEFFRILHLCFHYTGLSPYQSLSISDILRAGQSEGVLPMPSFFKKEL